MMDSELAALEAQLLRTRPAAPPAELIARLVAASPTNPARQAPARDAITPPTFLETLLRFLLPAMALIALVGFVGRQLRTAPGMSPATAGLVWDDVQIDQKLLSSFDAIAQLPGGEPIRLRCAQWQDQVVLRNSATGFEIRETRPRLEVVPVSFETD